MIPFLRSEGILVRIQSQRATFFRGLLSKGDLSWSFRATNFTLKRSEECIPLYECLPLQKERFRENEKKVVFCFLSSFLVLCLATRRSRMPERTKGPEKRKNEKTKKLSFFAGETVCHTCLKVYVDETNDHPFEYNFQTLFFTLSSAHGGDSIHTHARGRVKE